MKCPVCLQEMKGFNHAQDEKRLREYTKELSIRYATLMIEALNDIKEKADEIIDEVQEDINAMEGED